MSESMGGRKSKGPKINLRKLQTVVLGFEMVVMFRQTSVEDPLHSTVKNADEIDVFV